MKIYLLVALVLLCNQTFARENIPKNRAVAAISAYNTHILVKITPPFVDVQGCASTSGDILRIKYDDPGKGKAMYAAVLAAAEADRTVGFGIDGCSGQYPKVYRVDVEY